MKGILATKLLGAGTPIAIKAFTGREWDPETGLYYYRARYYDPKAGRFISEDPIGFWGGINFYGYVSGNPATAKDPFGLADLKGVFGANNALFQKGLRDNAKVSGEQLSGAGSEAIRKGMSQSEAEWMYKDFGKHIDTVEEEIRALEALAQGTAEALKTLKDGNPLKKELEDLLAHRKNMEDSIRRRYEKKKDGAC